MKNWRKILMSALMIILSFFLLTQCVMGSGQTREKIKIEGSSTVFPITSFVVDDFSGMHKGVNITISENGTGGGFKSFTKGNTDINNASRKIKDKEKKEAVENDVSYTELKVAVDGITVVVNPQNSWIKDLTTEQLVKIFSEANYVKTWSEIDPSYPNTKINLYGPTDASGTYDFFGEKIFHEEGIPLNPTMVGTENDNEIVSNVSKDKNAIGFLGYAFYEANRSKIKGVSVDGVTPTSETIMSREYLISRDLYIYVNNEKVKNNQTLNDFVRFYVENPDTYVKKAGYISLSEQEKADEIEKYESIFE